jgi:Cys-tRNA(Pro)/Cys-tRNA(Cys) deacylase
MKTNAARILDSLGIAYQLRDYAIDEDDLTAESVARKVALPPEQVFKTLVCRGDKHGVCFAVVPADASLDLKALARLSGDKSIDTVALKEVQPLTGYIRGGVTALGGKKDFPVYVEETIELFDQVSISAGVRGTQLLLAPGDYLRATRAKVGAISRSPV